MFKGISRIITDVKTRTRAYNQQADQVRADIVEIEKETQEIEAETAVIRAYTQDLNEEKVKLFNYYAARIEEVQNPVVREEMMRYLVESSMGKAARRKFH